MSVLFPLYLFGLLAVGLPLAFHLLRKTPRGQQLFGSLMFLSPARPRLTRRSRLDHLLLLLLRALAVICIALAFARPFQRIAAMMDLSRTAGNRVVILVDTSASMRRTGLWDKARKEIDQRLDALRPQDQVALISFDDTPEIISSFPEKGASSRKRTQSAGVAKQAMLGLSPSWRDSNLGAGLAAAADLLDAAKDKDRTDELLDIVLVSDFQEGSNLDALQSYEWPKGVSVTVQLVDPEKPTNATLRILPAEDDADPSSVRVRGSNDSDSQKEEFRLVWRTSSDAQVGEATSVYAPPGQTRVVRLERPPEAEVNRLTLLGDDAEFDNQFFATAPLQRTLRVVYIGGDKADDANGLIYYLQRAFADGPFRKIEFDLRAPSEPLVFDQEDPPDSVVIGADLSDSQTAQLKAYISSGERALVVLQEKSTAASLRTLLEIPDLTVENVVERDYAMLGQIEFRHPLFAAFADPRFSDFTNIRFWKRRRLTLGSDQTKSLKVLAKFDNGDPAILEKSIGGGQLYLLAGGWSPSESQLALSTKFVPLVSWLLDRRESETTNPQLTVGDAAVAAMDNASAADRVETPAGDSIALGEDGRFATTDEPGVYRFVGDKLTTTFAVNLNPRESATAALDPGVLEPFGVRLGRNESVAEKLDRQRQKQDTELEFEQSYWRWFLAGALLLLAAESWLSGWYSRPVEQGLTT